MKKIIILLVLIQLSYNGFSQTCDCSSNLNWLIETFEKNDAGFKYVIDEKGEYVYLEHNKLYLEKASKISDLSECHKLLNNWTEFFRKNHLQVELIINTNNLVQQKELSKEETIKKFQNSPKFEIKNKKFEKYLNNLKDKTGFEGAWLSEPYEIGIIKDNKNPYREYVGFIIKSESPYWQKNQIKLEIFKTKEEKYNMKYYMNDHTSREIENINIEGNNYLLANFIVLKRLKPVINPNSKIAFFLKSKYTERPFIEKVSNNTLLLRIPSFRYELKNEIDNLLLQNDSLIKNNFNLIIDLRNNGGGSDESYKKIIPYLYTNPIREIGVAYLSTELNNKRMVDFINNPDWSTDDKKWATESLEKLSKHIGKFVNLDENIVSTDTLGNIYPNPTNIAILINGECGSTTEQFLLTAKQSKKVKLFGTTTVGSLDISNLYSVDSPSKEFRLWYGLTKSYRIPEMSIDEKGIQPDYYFDETIKQADWLEKTVEILNYR